MALCGLVGSSILRIGAATAVDKLVDCLVGDMGIVCLVGDMCLVFLAGEVREAAPKGGGLDGLIVAL